MIDIEEKEPKVFDNEPEEITIEDAKNFFNARYALGERRYDLGADAKIEAGVKGFIGSLNKLPSQLRMAGGQAMFAQGEKILEQEGYWQGIRERVLPKGDRIFNGNLGVKVGEKLKESGKYNIMTANRNIETLNREIQNNMPNLSEEDRNSWTMMIAEQGLDYGVMLGLSYINPALGMGYMGAKIFGQETEEGAEAYKRKYGTIEGFENLSGEELTLNVANTAVQEVIEKAFGAPAQIKRFKTMKDFGKAFLTGFGEEFITENLQNVSDAVFDHIGKRLDEDETLLTQIMDNFKGTLVAGMFGGTAGTAFAIHNRAQGINNFEKLLDNSDVAPEDRNALATDLYESGVNNLQSIVTKELELNSQLRAKHGDVYNNMKKQIERQVRASGAFQGKSEPEVAQYLEGTAKQFADNVLAEAQLRNTLIDDVVNSNDIVFEKGRLRLAPKIIARKQRAYNPERMSLLTYLKYRGGLKDVGGELIAMDAGKQFIGLLNNKSGRSLDDAARDAWESGYFPQFPERPTVNDLLDAINDSLAGKKIYRETYRQEKEEQEYKARLVDADAQLDDFLSGFFTPEELNSMSQDSKLRLYSEYVEQTNAITEEEFIQQEFDALTEDEQERYSVMRENEATHEEAMNEIRARRNVGDLSDLYQESMDVAEENARLDDIYPAYEGDTITINGQEKTVYNSNGDRIAKSKEALENFYSWFGDSKVVDEQGRPLVVYHGTKAMKWGKPLPEFSIFSRAGSRAYQNRVGFFFGETDSFARAFGDRIMPVYLNLQNPKIFKKGTPTNEELSLEQKEVDTAKSDDTKYIAQKILNNSKKYIDAYDKFIMDMYHKSGLIPYQNSMYGDFNDAMQLGRDEAYDIADTYREELQKDGYDGVIIVDTKVDANSNNGKPNTQYVAFNPNQIKSTSNRGTYSESENIYYQSAFAGSRVDYDRPSLEAIGSGEGAQVHGWGLYYALNRDVAEDYRESFVSDRWKINWDIKGKPLSAFLGELYNDRIDTITKKVHSPNKKALKENLISVLEDEAKQYREDYKKGHKSLFDEDAKPYHNPKDLELAELAEKKIDELKKLSTKDIAEQKGQVHEVDIPENPYLLDEQKPFSEQSDIVKKGIIDTLNSMNLTEKQKEKFRNNIENRRDTGKEIYEELVVAMGTSRGDGLISSSKENMPLVSKALSENGVKGITYFGRQDGRCFVIFNPEDVKVIQKFYQGKKGKIKGAFDKLTKSIRITKDADFSTYQHEFAHFWLDNIWDYVNSGKASEDYVKRFDEIKKWLGVKQNQDYFTREQHEKFARGYEKFLYEGKAVNPIIASAFDDYEKFIREVYDDITEIDVRAGKEYEPLSREAYNFFNSMVSGELTPPANLPDETIEQARETVAKSETDAEEVVAEETKTLEENRANYKLEPVKTDTKTSYLTAYEKMTGEKVEAGVAELAKEMAKANEFVANNLELAEKIVNGEAPAPENMLKNTIYLAYQEMQKKLGNTEKRANALLNQAQELRAYGQEIASQKLAYADQSTPLYWLSRVMSARAESIAEGNKMTASELQDYINKEIRPAIGDEKAVENVVKTLAENLGIRELYQTEKVDFGTKDGVYKYVASKLGIIPTQEQTAEIIKRADDMLNNLKNAQTNGNPTVDYFVKYKDLENYANSIAPSNSLRVLVSVVGKGNLLASFKSPTTNIVANMPVAGLQAALRRQKLGVTKSIVDAELIKQNKKQSWEIYRKTGYTLNNMTDVSPKGMTLGERITQSQGEGAIRKLGRIYENVIYKWSLGAPDLLFKDFAFNDYVSLAATKESGGDVAKANEIYKDAIRIMPKTELGQEIRQAAIEDSLIATYQNNGKISEAALKIRKSLDFGVGFGEFIAPFVKTPANVVGMSLDTAFGGVRALTSEIIRDVKAGKVLTPKSENVRLIAQNGLGLLVASLLLGAIDDDNYMPSYSLATNRDKQIAKELNIPFNAIRIGNTWFSMDYLGPLASPLMGLLQARRENGIINSVMGYVKSGAIQTLSIPAFGNVGDLNEKISNIVRKDGVDALENVASQAIEATVARAVPSIVSDISKMLDENDREAKTLKEKLQAKTPLLREELPERYNVTTGKAMPRAENTVKRLLIDLFAGARVKEQVVNDMADELFRLNTKGYGASLTDVTRSGLLSKVDSEKKALIKKDFAQMYSKGVKELINTYRYKKADDEDKKDMIDSLRRKYVKELKNKYLKKAKR